MAGRFSVEAVFKAVDKVTAPVNRMQKRMSRFTRSASKGLGRVTRMANKMGDAIKKAGKFALAGAGLMAAAFANVTRAGADFGRAIGSAAAKFPEGIQRGTAEFKALEAAARDVGATTEFTATQAAEGLNFLAKAGFTAESAMASLRPIVDFATASEMEFAEAADIASDALGAFGLDSENTAEKLAGMQRVMDVMGKTANRTNTSVSELFESVKKAAPVATAAGVDIETFSATMGVLAQSGIKASEAGTAAKNITLALSGVGNQAAATFKRLKINLEDANGNARDQFAVLGDLRKRLQGMGGIQRTNVLSAIFGKIPIASANVLLADTTGKLEGLRKELQAAGGFSKKTAAFIRDDVKGSLDGLNSAIEGVKISIFSLKEGPLKDAIDQMTQWVRTNEKMIATNVGEFFLMIIENMGAIVKWSKRIAIATAVFFSFIAVLKTLATVLTVVNLLMAANPITLIVLAVIAAVAAFTALVIWIEEVVAWFEKLPLVVKLAAAPLWAFLRLIKTIKDNWQEIKGFGGKVAAFFGMEGGDSENGTTSTPPQVIGQGERIASSVKETITKNSAELTVKAAQGATVEQTGGASLDKMGVTLQPSGAFE